MKKLLIASTFAAAAFVAMPAFAADYYVAPGEGAIDNTGAKDQPWSTLQEVFESGKSFQPGDVIHLLSGEHGAPVIKTGNEGDVLIRAEEGQDPVLASIMFDGASHWTLQGVRVHRADAPPEPPVLEHPVYPKKENTLIRIAGESAHITISDVRVYSIEDSSAWTADDWNYKAWNGIDISGGSHHITVEDSSFRNTNFAIDISGGEYMTVRNCLIENYCGDGIRPNASNTVVENNRILNVYDTNGNHDDAIQAFLGGRGSRTFSNVVLRGNVIIDATHEYPLMGACQGIGLFDGWYEGWVIENNIVAVNHWHGISIYGARNSRIVNNTVVKNPVPAGDGIPWIRVVSHKNKEPSTGNIVRNNLTSSLSNADNIGTVDHNIVTTDYDAHFVDYQSHNFHLKQTSTAIDAGNPEHAPTTDFEGDPRTSPPDIGADEY